MVEYRRGGVRAFGGFRQSVTARSQLAIYRQGPAAPHRKTGVPVLQLARSRVRGRKATKGIRSIVHHIAIGRRAFRCRRAKSVIRFLYGHFVRLLSGTHYGPLNQCFPCRR